MKIIEILTTLLLPLALVSSSELKHSEVAVSNVPTQISYRALPASELLSLFKDAVSKNDPSRVHILLESHVPLSQSPDEETLQQKASYSSTDTNIPSSQDKFDISTTISDEGTLLQWATDRGYSDLIPVLLARGAGINSDCGELAATHFQLAAQYGHEAVITQLLSALSTQPELLLSLLTTKDNGGWTALHYAASNDHDAIVAQLLNGLDADPERIRSLLTAPNNEEKHHEVV